MASSAAPGPASPLTRGLSALTVRQPSKRMSHMPSSTRTVGTSVATTGSTARVKRQKLSPRLLLRLLRRVLTVAAAIGYMYISLTACARSIDVLKVKITPPEFYTSDDSVLLSKAAGEASIQNSPLVVEMLRNDTTPRPGTLFIDKDASYSRGCKSVAESVIYQDAFQRLVYAAVVDSLAYNLTFLDPTKTELVTPVVDCTLTPLVINDTTEPRFFFLTRKVKDPSDVSILVVTIGVQEYQDARHKAVGPAAIATIASVNDMRAKETIHHFAVALGYPHTSLRFKKYELIGLDSKGCWLLMSVPVNPAAEVLRVISTSAPSGAYISSPNEQSIIVYRIWELQQDPAKVLAHWVWYGRTVARDSWAWVHFYHFYYAASTATGLLVLLSVVFYNVRAGRIWVGDAFVAVSSTHKTRSALVLLSWFMDRLWTPMKFTLYTATQLSKDKEFVIFPSIMRADLLSLYITLVGVVGEVFKERIDPALTVGCFVLGFEARIEITKLFPSVVKALVDFADLDYMLGATPLDPQVPERTPLRVWNSKPLPRPSFALILSALLPAFSTLVFIVAYVIGRKLHRWKYPDLVAQQRSSLNSAKDSDGRRSNLTQFEFATGVALRDRFGVVSDYDNYVYIKGMKFASADGIYTSAFVIANGKFLVSIDDLIAIVVIKLTHVRFRNVFVYDVDGNAVKQTARLVYPETMSFGDLVHLNLKILL